jgi:hypothetical protein
VRDPQHPQHPVTPSLNPARLARFTDWAKTLPPRPLPRTVFPVAGEYYLDYACRLADANQLAFLELADTLHDPAAFTIGGPHGLQQHEKERLAVIASQPLARLCWPDPSYNLRDIEGFHRTLRPACRRCTARHGITGPIPCRLPPHQALCRRHQLWTGPSARSHDSQLDVIPFPEIGRAHRRHLALVHQHDWQHVDIAAGDATRAIYQAIRDGSWIPGQRERMQQLAPSSWQQALDGALRPRPGLTYDVPCHPAIEIAIYPDVIWLTARIVRARRTSHRNAP